MHERAILPPQIQPKAAPNAAKIAPHAKDVPAVTK